MDRKETEKETKATKNTKNLWKWILGIGVLLMAIAFWGGFLNHDEHFSEADNAATTVVDSTSEKSADTTGQVNPDTIMENVRGTK